jgi:lambda repressor-like predicted transcriptional regulator
VNVNLEAQRMDRGHSIRSAAAAMGVARATLERAERGQGVHPSSAKKIADFYEVKVTDIWPVASDEVAA